MARRLQDKIEELEEKHRVIAQNMVDAIWIVDVETADFEYITPSVERLTGYTVDEYLELSVEDRLTDDSLNIMKKGLAEEFRNFEQGIESTRRMELELIRKDGSICWVEISAMFYKEAGKILKIIGLTREITRQKLSDLKKNELIDKLTEALAEKEKLLKENKILRGLLPICSGCKRIRDEEGKWWPFDMYVKAKTEAQLTHTICRDCEKVFYPELK